MVIRKAVSTAETDAPTHRGRHPLLRAGSDHLMIYDFIRNHPGVSSDDIRTQLNVNHQRISELVAEGLIKVVGREGRYRKYEVAPENETGRGRLHVRVAIKIFSDTDGNFTATAELVDNSGKRLPTSSKYGGKLRQMKIISMLIPSATEAELEKLSGAVHDGTVIDADYEII